MTATKIKFRPGPVAPRDMDARQWASWASNAPAKVLQSAEGYALGNGYFLGEDEDGLNKFFVGDSTGKYVAFDGTDWILVGRFNWRNSFTDVGEVAWSGFSASPSTTSIIGLSYLGDTFSFKIGGVSNVTGTSNSTSFSAQWVVGAGVIGPFHVWTGAFPAIDNNNPVLATADVAYNGSSLTLNFNKFDVGTGQFSPTGWTNAGTKGIKAGTVLTAANIFSVIA